MTLVSEAILRETGLQKKENPLRQIYKQKQEYWTQERLFLMNRSDD